ncbi:hypothetical protein H0H87_001654, partial [Tephrocybe sp. NHM501043]
LNSNTVASIYTPTLPPRSYKPLHGKERCLETVTIQGRPKSCAIARESKQYSCLLLDAYGIAISAQSSKRVGITEGASFELKQQTVSITAATAPPFIFIMDLPSEILVKILREATFVAEALDTSLPVFSTDHEDIVQLIHESMITKSALSLVSKAFNNIMEDYLYEIVMIFRFKFIPVLLKLLRTAPLGLGTTRGQRCRRFDLYLGVGHVEYLDEGWYEGGHTLWGLLPSCPNLEILLARVIRSKEYKYETPHLTHNALWKSIATYCPKTLRRLDLNGFQIRMDRVEMMLRYLVKLEVCRIVRVTEFNPQIDVYDDEEPKKRCFYRNYQLITLFDTSDARGPSGWFDAATVSQFKAAKNHSVWPPFVGIAPYILPSLHTLILDYIDIKRMKEFLFPSLGNLGMTLSAGCDYENARRSFRLFPPSLTHVVYSGLGMAMDQLILLFPYLQFVSVAIDREDLPESHFNGIPHNHLEVIELASWADAVDPTSSIRELLDAVRAKKLPMLRVIRNTRFDTGSITYDELLPFDESKEVDVALETNVKKQLTLCGLRTWHG